MVIFHKHPEGKLLAFMAPLHLQLDEKKSKWQRVTNLFRPYHMFMQYQKNTDESTKKHDLEHDFWREGKSRFSCKRYSTKKHVFVREGKHSKQPLPKI